MTVLVAAASRHEATRAENSDERAEQTSEFRGTSGR